jgi:RNA 3'-terminal phosphate cyclase
MITIDGSTGEGGGQMLRSDQLMLPLAMLAGGTYRTCDLRTHSNTNMQVHKDFCVQADCGVQVECDAMTSCVTVQPLG